MKLSRLRHIIKEEIQSLTEVKPFVDPKLQAKWDGEDANNLVYLATNDHRYPTEIVIWNPNKDVFHFVHNQMGIWANATQETVSVNRLPSSHWVQPFYKDALNTISGAVADKWKSKYGG